MAISRARERGEFLVRLGPHMWVYIFIQRRRLDAGVLFRSRVLVSALLFDLVVFFGCHASRVSLAKLFDSFLLFSDSIECLFS